MEEVNKTNLQLDLPQDPDPTISVNSINFFLFIWKKSYEMYFLGT